MNAVRLEELRTKHRVVAADLAAIVARADQRRADIAELKADTQELLAELERVVAATAELLQQMAPRRASATGR